MTDDPSSPAVPSNREAWLHALWAEQAEHWRRGERALVETDQDREQALAADAEALLDLIYSEVLLREERSERPTLEEYLRHFPQQEASLRRQFDLYQAFAASSLIQPPNGVTLYPPAGGHGRLTGDSAIARHIRITADGSCLLRALRWSACVKVARSELDLRSRVLAVAWPDSASRARERHVSESQATTWKPPNHLASFRSAR